MEQDGCRSVGSEGRATVPAGSLAEGNQRKMTRTNPGCVAWLEAAMVVGSVVSRVLGRREWETLLDFRDLLREGALVSHLGGPVA